MENKELFGEPIWLFKAIFGSKYIDDAIENNLSMEGICNNYKFQLFHHYKSEKNNIYLICMNSAQLEWQFVGAEPISNYEAYKLYGIKAMEDAQERTYTVI